MFCFFPSWTLLIQQKKEKEKSYVPSKHHQYLVSIIKIPKMMKIEKKEARLDRGT